MTDQRTIITMFDDIAPRYDFLNRLLSFHLDTHWRHRVSKIIKSHNPSVILDVATGTADLAIQMAKDNPQAKIIGIDLSQAMLDIGHSKVDKLHLSQQITLQKADAQHLPFPDHSFDIITVSFGVRNFEDINEGLQEMLRVSKKEGLVAILEFSQPKKDLVKIPYRWYSRLLLPRIGKAVSKHPNAYTYLPESIQAFYPPESFVEMMKKTGFSQVREKSFCGGIATLYLGKA